MTSWSWSSSSNMADWLCTVENDLKQQNLGLWSAQHRAYDREISILLQGHAT